MTQTAHTPGDWVVPDEYKSEVENVTGQTIASCWHTHAVGQTINLHGVIGCSLEESSANARLISAAPDMLDALKYARRFLKPDDVDVAYIDAAIAKAEGVTP